MATLNCLDMRLDVGEGVRRYGRTGKGGGYQEPERPFGVCTFGTRPLFPSPIGLVFLDWSVEIQLFTVTGCQFTPDVHVRVVAHELHGAVAVYRVFAPA
jgi:hypothetical protein